MQTILGSNGVIGKNLARTLALDYGAPIRLVGRNPKPINSNDELFVANLLDKEQVLKAVQGSQVVYLTAGLPYDIKIWRTQWPVVMQNVIDACKTHNARLVFFDNVYMYGKVMGEMTEETPLLPTSEKGKVRKQIVQMLIDEVEKGALTATIARSADFYGPDTPLSFVTMMLFEKFAQLKKGQWMVSDAYKHSFTYTPDAGKFTALLGNTPSAYNQVWHLPTAPAITGKEFIAIAAQQFGAAPKYSILSKTMLKLVGFFIKPVKESIEMLYQMEDDYIFNSTKFENYFAVLPTSYEDGLKATAKFYKK